MDEFGCFEEHKSKVMPTSTPSTTTEPYEIKYVTQADYPRVLHHLQRFFFKDEPLNVSINLLGGKNTCPELEDFSKKCLDHGCSYMAVSSSDEVVGVSVNAVDRPSDGQEEAEDCGNPKFQKIINLLMTIDCEVDIFNRYKDVNSVMNCKILSVDSTWRGRGIAKQLLDKTRDVARQQGQQLMRVDCTSHYSAKAIARLGFECIYTKQYADYKVDCEAVFTPEPPHTEVAVYVQAITPAQKL
ncbi:arylalkylamine N-acetyltransferase 1-like isoform X3 [Atheta coriaria]|uniref:arylalkylamine N-acetyltransferase 1-like isoform X3 n=1 Tax=Dalotia coriaria TaxID=877792 RepID=UPI0031F3B470